MLVVGTVICIRADAQRGVEDECSRATERVPLFFFFYDVDQLKLTGLYPGALDSTVAMQSAMDSFQSQECVAHVVF